MLFLWYAIILIYPETVIFAVSTRQLKCGGFSPKMPKTQNGFLKKSRNRLIFDKKWAVL